MKRTLTGFAVTVVALALVPLRGQDSPDDLKFDGTNPPALLLDTNAEPKVVQPAQINLSPALSEVVRLAQSGAEESVVVAYIQKAPTYQINSDEIIYLQDLGISEAVLKALVEHSQRGPDGSIPAIPAAPVATNPPTPPVVEAPLTPSAPPATVAEFYEPLSPYGTWIEVAPYGWCWQPSVVVVNPGWHPYADRGHWLWSDAGWYWHSYYSWGWAPFHYGRWYQHPRRGWCWAPDRVWGPSWVSWRNSRDHCGWAPLPPGAHFSAGIGWSFHGRRVSHDFSFGLSTPHFTFVATSHFLDRHVRSRSLHRREADVVIRNTTIINNYTTGPQNRIVNRGIDRNQIETATRTRVREVSVRELPRDSRRATMPDRVTREGNTEVVYRPGPNIQVPRRTTSPAAATLSAPRSVPGLNRPARGSQVPRDEIRGADAVASPNAGSTPGRRNGSAQPGVRPSAPQGGTETPAAGDTRRLPQRSDARREGTPSPAPPAPRTAPATPSAPPQGRPIPTPGPQRDVPSLPPQRAPNPNPPARPERTSPPAAAPSPRYSPPAQPRNIPRRDERRGSASLSEPAPRVTQPSNSGGPRDQTFVGRVPRREVAVSPQPRTTPPSPRASRPESSHNARPAVTPRQSTRSVERSAPSGRSSPSRAESGRRHRSDG